MSTRENDTTDKAEMCFLRFFASDLNQRDSPVLQS